MILLLDAHVLLWWLFDDANLRASARRAIADPATDVLISAATIWEIAIKRELGRLRAPSDLVAAISASEFDILPVDRDRCRGGGCVAPPSRRPVRSDADRSG